MIEPAGSYTVTLSCKQDADNASLTFVSGDLNVICGGRVMPRRDANAWSAPRGPRRCWTGCARRRRASCAPTATSRPARPAMAGAVLHDTDEPDLPWYRIVRADGSLAKGRRQRRLLEAEGVPFRGDRVDMRVARMLGDD